MASWDEFAGAAPDLAAYGYERFRRFGVGLGFLATVTPDGAPRVHPVCPIWASGRLFLLLGKRTPKADDLRHEPRYMLHAFPDDEDKEFSVRGRASEVTDEQTRTLVVDAIDFVSYDPTDPIFELDIERADRTRWLDWGTPDHRPVRDHWAENS